VEGTAPVDVVEVEDDQRDLWDYEVNQELEWSTNMPFRKNLGGGRMRKAAPPITWYRNPQFRVKRAGQKEKEEPAEKNECSKSKKLHLPLDNMCRQCSQSHEIDEGQSGQL